MGAESGESTNCSHVVAAVEVDPHKIEYTFRGKCAHRSAAAAMEDGGLGNLGECVSGERSQPILRIIEEKASHAIVINTCTWCCRGGYGLRVLLYDCSYRALPVIVVVSGLPSPNLVVGDFLVGW